MAEEKKENTAKIDQAKQDKLKNQAKVTNQDDELKTESPAKLKKMLSNKNSDYVFRLQKELEKQGNLSADEAAAKVDSMLAEIVIAQRHGQPANGLYLASPVIKASQILHPDVKPKSANDLPFWQRAVDNALLWLAIFMAMYGIMGLINTKLNNQNGVLTIIILGVLLGIFTVGYNDWIMPADSNGKRNKISWIRVILISLALVAIMLVVMGVLTLPQLRIINPVLPGIVYIIIAVVAYGARYFFRKKFNIVGSTVATRGK